MSVTEKHITETPWAMTRESLETLVLVAHRQGDVESLEKRLGEKPRNSYRATIRDGVGLLPIRGPLFKRANLFTEVSGATSYDLVLRDFHEMLNSPDVKSIVFDIDSPGGEANGCAELAEHIFKARGTKPITAYIGGSGASAAYWIASACDQVVGSETAIVGSIGVQMVLRDKKDEDELRFVSSQSPNKNRDPSTKEGKSEVQRVIDDLAEVFVQKVARNRSLSRLEVLEKFGGGSVFVGHDAKNRGMIDTLGTLEDLMTVQKSDKPEVTIALISEKYPEIAAHFIQHGETRSTEAAVKRERARIFEIQKLCHGRVSKEFSQSLIDECVAVEKAALRILTESNDQGVRAIESLEKSEQDLEGLNSKPFESSEEDLLNQHMNLAKSLGIPFR